MSAVNGEGPDDLDQDFEVLEDVDLEPDEGEDGEAAEEDDEGLEASDADDGDEDEPAPVKKEGRYAVLARRAKEAETRAEAAERRAQEALDRQTQGLQRRDRAAWEAQVREKLENMLPEERIAYQTEQRLQQMQHQMAQMQFHANEMAERAAFSAEARVNTVYSKYESRVEQMKKDFLTKGQNVSRENILKHLIGEDALKRGAKAGQKQRSAGSARKAAASGRQQSGRSDTTSSSRREKTLEERLEGVLI